MNKWLKVVVGFSLIVLFGCSSASIPNPSNDKDPVVVYHRWGGYAGWDETWSIFIEGRVQHTGHGSGQSSQLTNDRIDQLLALIRSIDLALIKDSYIGANTCCDRFFYEITINLDSQTKTIKTIDGAMGEPVDLINLMAAIGQAVLL